MTKLAILSDIHTEFEAFDPDILLEDNPDVVILAGDIGVGTGGVAFAKTLDPTPVIYVPGNHEYYRQQFFPNLNAMIAMGKGTNVRVLDGESVEIGGVLFVGATLWTDYALNGNQVLALAECKLADQHYITYDGGPFTTAMSLKEHRQAKRALVSELELYEGYEDKTVVVTHHAPHPNSIAPQYRDTDDRLTPAFCSDLSNLISRSGQVVLINCSLNVSDISKMLHHALGIIHKTSLLGLIQTSNLVFVDILAKVVFERLNFKPLGFAFVLSEC